MRFQPKNLFKYLMERGLRPLRRFVQKRRNRVLYFQAKANVGLLMRLSPNEHLLYGRKGRLRKVSAGYFRAVVVATGGWALHRRRQAIKNSLLLFCHELHNPLSVPTLRKLLLRKRAVFALAVRGALLMGVSSSFCTAVWQLYERATLLQIHLIQRAWKAVRRHPVKEPFHFAVLRALATGYIPSLTPYGTSGSYVFKDERGNLIAFFKPFDEESHAPNNPRGVELQGALGKRMMRMGLLVGENFHREVAASVVDRWLGFGLVPKTVYAELSHWVFYNALEGRKPTGRAMKTKVGSLQEFVVNEGQLWIGVSQKMIAAVSLSDLQRLAVLDVVIGNLDRHLSNVLYTQKQIWAIDNGLSFPDMHLDSYKLQWTELEQAKEPFSEEMRALILSLDADALAQKLHRECFLSLESMQRMRERIALVQEAARAGALPAQVGELMQAKWLNPLRNYHALLQEKAALVVKEALPKLKK